MATKLRFVKSPSKLSSKRKAELLKVGRIAAIKALGTLSSNPEKLFAALCDEEISERMNVKTVLNYSPEIKSLRLAFVKATSALQKKRVLSIVALEHSYRSLKLERCAWTNGWCQGKSCKRNCPGPFMMENEFQLLPQTIAFLGLNNAAKSVEVDAKELRQQKLHQHREKAAKKQANEVCIII